VLHSYRLWNTALSSEDLNLFSYEILGLVGRDGAGPHDLRQMVQRGRMVDWAGESRYYVEPKRLARLGYLEARKEPGRTGPRTVYSLTAKGLAALRDWAGTPLELTPIKSEPLLRMLVTDLVGEAPTCAAITTLRADIAALSARVDEMEAGAAALHHREKYLRLAASLLRRLLAAHLDWIEEVERELGDHGLEVEPGDA